MPHKPDYRESAAQYDEQVKAYSSYGHEVIFGMCYEYIKPKEKLLDIGIGTGLASKKFSDAGLKVYGLDNSPEMLSACQSKSFAKELRQCDISHEPIPYRNKHFHLAVCCGVMHFLSDLSGLLSEVKRVLKGSGVFAFTIAPQETDVDYIKEPTAWGIPIFKHAPGYVANLLKSNGMELLKEQRLLMKGADKIHFDMLFSVMIAECKSAHTY